MATSTDRVPVMSCAACKAAVEDELRGVEGIEVIEVDLAGKLVTVRGETSDADVRRAIAEAGYEVDDGDR